MSHILFMKNFSYSAHSFNVNTQLWEDRIVVLTEDDLLKQLRFWNVTQFSGKSLSNCFSQLIDMWNLFEIKVEAHLGEYRRKRITYVALPEDYVKEHKQVDFV